MTKSEEIIQNFTNWLKGDAPVNLAEEPKTKEATEVKFELNAPDGEYISADGGVITISDNSISYAEGMTEEEAAPVEESAEELAEEPKEEPKTELSEAEKLNQTLLASVEELKAKVVELEKVEKISSAPQKEAKVELTINPNASAVERAQMNFLKKRLNK